MALIGLVVFGPEQLPKMAAQAGRALRDLRRLADNARSDLSESLGPEFHDFDFNDLNPRAFVRKHLLDPVDEDPSSWSDPAADAPYGIARTGPGVRHARARRSSAIRLRGNLTQAGVSPSWRPARLRDLAPISCAI